MDEFSFIEYLKKKIPARGRVRLGIGDDAAVLDIAKDKMLAVSTDVIVENVDFRIKTLSPEKIGRKALAVNLSDIAAMGASPSAFVISIGKPARVTTTWLKRFYSGLLALATQYDVPCIGGDLSRSKEFFANVTIFGEVSLDHLVKRSGATHGDWIAVTGALGGSIIRHHYDFTPRVREGVFIAGHITPTAMIDISDGLVQDLPREDRFLLVSREVEGMSFDEIAEVTGKSSAALRTRMSRIKQKISSILANKPQLKEAVA